MDLDTKMGINDGFDSLAQSPPPLRGKLRLPFLILGLAMFAAAILATAVIYLSSTGAHHRPKLNSAAGVTVGG
jgi:hypothetical protein